MTLCVSELTVVFDPYTNVYKFAKWAPTCNELTMYFYNDTHAARKEGCDKCMNKREQSKGDKNGWQDVCVHVEDLGFPSMMAHTIAPNSIAQTEKRKHKVFTHTRLVLITHVHFSLHI